MKRYSGWVLVGWSDGLRWLDCGPLTVSLFSVSYLLSLLVFLF
jgi:hypothetical protein